MEERVWQADAERSAMRANREMRDGMAGKGAACHGRKSVE